MSNEFFREIAHREVPWGDRSIAVPVFYRNVMSLAALLTASAERLRARLPSPRCIRSACPRIEA